MVADILATCGYRVLTAANGREALALLAQPPCPVHLVVTDVVMPAMGGGELLRHLRADHPDLPVLLMSGHVDRREGIPEGFPLLPKPFTCQALTGLVRQMLDAPTPAAVH
jgi:CheY-like chemotaxis protein